MNLFKTRVTELFGIEYPIILGGMLFISRAELAAAVSEAGGLGVVAAGTFYDTERVREEIRKVKEFTSRPFAVNVPIFKPNSAEVIKVAIEEGVTVIATSAGSPKKFTSELKEKGLIVYHVVASVAHAQKAEAAGVDAVVAEGIEAGGHDSPDQIPVSVLIPQVVDAVKIPVIAAGGIADGRGYVAARFLGAEGVQLGTRFMVSKESPLHPDLKKLVIETPDNGTVLVGMKSTGHPIRVIKTDSAINLLAEEEKNPEHARELLNSMELASDVYYSGRIEEGVVMCGQSAGLIKEELSVREIFDEIIREVNELHSKFCD